ncbi:MAG: hypothetical protein M3R00_02630, partial [Pseudomonadota bacterium]|nr:hypothetical protein [Pseudomonadota bacterium]
SYRATGDLLMLQGKFFEAANKYRKSRFEDPDENAISTALLQIATWKTIVPQGNAFPSRRILSYFSRHSAYKKTNQLTKLIKSLIVDEGFDTPSIFKARL